MTSLFSNLFCKHKLTDIVKLRELLVEANKANIINSHVHTIMNGTLQISQLRVRDIMVPKSKMVVIKNDASFEEYLGVAVTSAHSRFPVVDTDEKVSGIILAKDLLAFLATKTDPAQFDYRDYMRETIVVPEEKSLESLMEFFQQKRSHLMIVIDEYGEISGLVTLEDVLEQIVGDITDEHDFETDNIIDYDKGRFLIKGETSISEFNEYFSTRFDSTHTETIAGLIVKEFGYMPQQLESISIQGLQFKVLKSNDRRVLLLEMELHD